ncbi:MAG: SIMPL domain-containing protein [Candidatus Saccharibacteria bacterium]|nr:SIMPL domain-containing protein [Candidatus Saccharibacteria bacterium]
MQKKSIIVILIFVAFVVAAFFLKSQPDNVSAGVVQYREKMMDKPPQPVVQVSVSENVKFIADDFVVRLNLEMREGDKNSLVKKMTERRTNLFAMLKNLNVSEANVEQSSVELRKMWNYGNGKNSLRGYRASQCFKVRVNSRAAVNDLEKAVLQIPDVEMRGMTAGLKNPDSLQKNVAKAACEKAYAKALEYAKSVNEKLGPILNVIGDVRMDDYSDEDSVRIMAAMSIRVGLFSGSASKKTLITVETENEKNFAADEYDVSLNLQFTGKDANKLYNQVAERRTTMLELMKNMDIPESAVEQSSVNLEKDWNYRKDPEALLGYHASQSFVVRVSSRETAAMLVEALSSVEDVEIRHVEARLKSIDSVQSALLKETSNKAMNKANSFAAGFHGTLGKILYVGDGTNVSDAFGGAVHAVMDRMSLQTNRAHGFLKSMTPDFSAIADSVPVQSHVKLIVEMK